MDLRSLEYFTYIAQLGSFSRAANHLHITQPALSRRIQQLEAELGVELMKRHGRGVELTASGRILLDRAGAMLHQMRQVRHDVVEFAGVPAGQVTVAMPPAAGRILAPRVAACYRRLYPKVTLHFLEAASSQMYEWLEGGRTELAVLHNPGVSPRIAVIPLLLDHLFVVGPRTDDGAPSLYSFADLAALPLILPSRPHALRLLIEHAAAQNGSRLDVIMEVDGLPLVKGMIEAGLGYTILTRSAVHDEILRGTLTAVPFVPPGISWHLGVAHRRDRALTVAAAELLRVIRQEVEQLVREGVWHGGPEPTPRAPPSRRAARASRHAGKRKLVTSEASAPQSPQRRR